MIEVGPMDQEESSQLISRRLEDHNLDTKQTSLAALLENTPLVLVQAAAFIHENSLTVTIYIELFEQGNHSLVELQSQPFEVEGRDSSVPNAVTTACDAEVVDYRRESDKVGKHSIMRPIHAFPVRTVRALDGVCYVSTTRLYRSKS
ncbi:hypothetical protein K432DRAFT_444751 [Lepidopterella palustris CBS 459.81]|uniref:Uncharacterized protein n=1 Tax=Lepidopterella palustris CBS 459.81 TaxID=1314670 RepID=A0A8E2E6K6_9PEZI|nr:hypothetical protein K432DRAFT_444751 [Lepidopterella palustris CBS 459.81]